VYALVLDFSSLETRIIGFYSSGVMIVVTGGKSVKADPGIVFVCDY